MAFLQLPISFLCIILLLLSTVSFSHAKTKPGKCPGSDQEAQEQRRNYTMDASDVVFLVTNQSGLLQMPLRKIRGADANNTRVVSTIHGLIELCRRRPDGPGVDESSFNITIVMRNQTTRHWGHTRPHAASVLSFLILPREALQVNGSMPLAKELLVLPTSGYQLNLTKPTYQMRYVSDREVYVATGMLGSPARTGQDSGKRAVGVDIIIRPPASSYSVWIDYDRVGRWMSVYVDMEGKPKPANPIAEGSFNISSIFSLSPTSPFVYFGLLSTLEQRRSTTGIHFGATVEDFPDYHLNGSFLSKKVTVLSSILGSVATSAVMAMAVMCYFNSRYRRWHKELKQLAKSMERLPGVPTKVDFADINKATGNFSETMKLGGGGFGTVYRCTLPAAASKMMGRPIDVAVKRFTRDVQNNRYDDFLAEVSIINRLRHKNIVPLVGWSYNKGEPLLVFEYMTNGSLDQHLFRNGGSVSGYGTAIREWSTRYEIIKGIATGLHYVHQEYEPMVLHRDIKASNVMLDSSFRARLGDFGLACTVATDRMSVTGAGGTWGYIAPEYAMCRKTTQQTDIYALGVLILEVVTGQRALADHHQVVDDDEVHITDRIWKLHLEGRLSECVDRSVLAAASQEDKEWYISEEATHLLLLGLACSNPNPSDRPTMPDVMQIIAKSTPPPKVPLQKPRFVWPPQEEWGSGDDNTGSSMMSDLDWSTDMQPMAQARINGRYGACQV